MQFDETTMLAFVVGAVAAIDAGVALAFERSYSRGLLLLVPVLALLLMAFGRWAYRGTADLRRRPTGTEEAITAVVYGAGDAGHQIASGGPLGRTALRILAFVDDDPAAIPARPWSPRRRSRRRPDRGCAPARRQGRHPGDHQG